MCFCKQKTAYEMRISDWSSDVCSSDLDPALPMVGLLGRIRCPTRRWEEDDRSRASIRPFGNLVGASCPAGGACRIAGRDPRWRSAPDLDSLDRQSVV